MSVNHLLASLTGEVDVAGERWASGRADDFAHPLEVCLARACVTLAVPRIGTVANRLGGVPA
jgi:hypothetical protein